MMNVDGLILGNTCSNIKGVDMTRNWWNPDQKKNPIVFELKRYIKELDEKFNI